MKTGEKLKLIQKIAGLTQEKLAQKLGVSFVTLNRWLNNKTLPRKKAEKRIDELFLELTGQKIIPKDALLAKKKIIATKSKESKNMLKTILDNPDLYDQFMLSLTYNTNSIEGSTLTEPETAAILFQNIALPNKTLIEQLEVKNHQAALEYLLKYLTTKNKLNEALILKLHGILMNGIREDMGSYRCHGVRILGANMPTANYLKVPELMKKLTVLLSHKDIDAINHAADIHSQFEKIHPFSDGNGRVGRLIMNAMLLRKNLAPAIIKQENKRFYYTYLNKAQQEDDLSLLEDFICDAIFEGFKILERKY